LQYHTSFPGEDPLNRDNPIIPEVRVFYYGILSVPYTLLDGRINEFDYFLKDLNKKDIMLQSLNDPEFRIDIQTFYHATYVDVEVTVQASEPIPLSELTLHVVIIENEITGIEGLNGESAFQDVVKAFVPDPAGTYIYKEWSPGDFETLFYTWVYDKVFDVSQLRVVTFIQDEDTKEIYQAAIDKFDITNAISDRETAKKETIIEILPNPVQDKILIRFHKPLESDCYLSICGIDGRIVSNDIIKAGTDIHKCDAGSFTQGLYFINLFSDKEFINSHRIMVNHR
jgi:hypothetical protein